MIPFQNFWLFSEPASEHGYILLGCEISLRDVCGGIAWYLSGHLTKSGIPRSYVLINHNYVFLGTLDLQRFLKKILLSSDIAFGYLKVLVYILHLIAYPVTWLCPVLGH